MTLRYTITDEATGKILAETIGIDRDWIRSVKGAREIVEDFECSLAHAAIDSETGSPAAVDTDRGMGTVGNVPRQPETSSQPKDPPSMMGPYSEILIQTADESRRRLSEKAREQNAEDRVLAALRRMGIDPNNLRPATPPEPQTANVQAPDVASDVPAGT